jgi:hypothetical protein
MAGRGLRRASVGYEKFFGMFIAHARPLNPEEAGEHNGNDLDVLNL